MWPGSMEPADGELKKKKKKVIICIFFQIRFFKLFEVFKKIISYNLKEVNLLEEIYEAYRFPMDS